ncbi:MAG: hypothetical protein OJF51_000036 [Nitrospira sp.]|jgi:uncharacterized protein with HEPN domain|nr:MAG: hypothetical protein OJF51_000036 [Nitrospira sp.]
MSRDWVCYFNDILELEIIREAAKHLPPEGLAMMPGVDWSKAAGFRDVIVMDISAWTLM